jgi:hypothetical protein
MEATPRSRDYVIEGGISYVCAIFGYVFGHKSHTDTPLDTRNPLQLTVIYQDSTFHCFYALNFRQSPSMVEFTIILVYFATFMLSTCDKVLQSLSYAGFKSSQVPHTYSVSQPPPSYVYSRSNRHPKITRIHGIIAGLEDSQVLCSQLASKCFNH